MLQENRADPAMPVAPMIWRFISAPDGRKAHHPLPLGIMTPGVTRLSERLPVEIEYLLPRRSGSTDWRDDLVEHLRYDPALAVGLFLSDPFVGVDPFAAVLRRLGARWICNLPSTAQFDPDFAAALGDVGLGHRFEMKLLSQLIEHGFEGIATIATPREAKAARVAGAAALFVIPRIGDYANGFPRLSERQLALKAIRDVLDDPHPPLFTLVTEPESHCPELWSAQADGAFVQPRTAVLSVPKRSE